MNINQTALGPAEDMVSKASTGFMSKLKNLDQDQKDTAMALVNTVVVLFKIAMASLLILFVPVGCNSCADYDKTDPNMAWCQYCIADNTCPESLCSISQRWEMATGDMNSLTFWSFVVNILTSVLLIGHLIMVMIREKYIIDMFDEDNDQPDNNLNILLDGKRTILDIYPEIKAGLYKWNHRLKLLSLWAMGVMIFNFTLMAVDLLTQGAAGEGRPLGAASEDSFSKLASKTVTVFITNALLIFGEVWMTYGVVSNEYAADSVRKWEPLSYNIIDYDHQDPAKEEEIQKARLFKSRMVHMMSKKSLFLKGKKQAKADTKNPLVDIHTSV